MIVANPADRSRVEGTGSHKLHGNKCCCLIVSLKKDTEVVAVTIEVEVAVAIVVVILEVTVRRFEPAPINPLNTSLIDCPKAPAGVPSTTLDRKPLTAKLSYRFLRLSSLKSGLVIRPISNCILPHPIPNSSPMSGWQHCACGRRHGCRV